MILGISLFLILQSSHIPETGNKLKPGDIEPKDAGTKEDLKESKRKEPSIHEEMGAFIVLNTKEPGGITRILIDHGFSENEINEIANIIVGRHDNVLYNQLMHSDLDVDRIDYMNRDAKNSGIIYGMFDSEYLIESMKIVDKPEPNPAGSDCSVLRQRDLEPWKISSLQGIIIIQRLSITGFVVILKELRKWYMKN